MSDSRDPGLWRRARTAQSKYTVGAGSLTQCSDQPYPFQPLPAILSWRATAYFYWRIADVVVSPFDRLRRSATGRFSAPDPRGKTSLCSTAALDWSRGTGRVVRHIRDKLVTSFQTSATSSGVNRNHQPLGSEVLLPCHIRNSQVGLGIEDECAACLPMDVPISDQLKKGAHMVRREIVPNSTELRWSTGAVLVRPRCGECCSFLNPWRPAAGQRTLPTLGPAPSL